MRENIRDPDPATGVLRPAVKANPVFAAVAAALLHALRALAARGLDNGRPQRAAQLLIFALSIAIIVAVGHQLTRSLDYALLASAIRHTHYRAISLAAAATAVSFAILMSRDVSALRYANSRAPWYAIFLAGFCGVSLSNAVGLGGLSGAAVRYRVYGAAGVRPDAIAQIVLFIAVGSSLGVVISGGLVCLLAAPQITALAHWPLALIWTTAGVLMTLPACGVLALRGRTLRLRGVSMPCPGTRQMAVQVLVTALDLAVSAVALWSFLPQGSVDLPTFVPVFVFAVTLGGLSHLPGGVGVFEAVVLVALHGHIPADQTAAALILYRAVYYIVPLFLSAGFLAGFEVHRFRHHGDARPATTRFVRSAARMSPAFLAVLTFAAGVLLLVSGAMPVAGQRLTPLTLHLPRWLLETSHFLGSIEGVLLIFIARGLFHRLDGAWWIAIILTPAALALSLIEGLPGAGAAALAALILLLALTRQQFSRRTSLTGPSFSLSWFIAAGSLAFGLLWMVMFAVQNTRLSDRLWWQVEINGQAPGSLRLMLGLSILAVACGLAHLLRVTQGHAEPPAAGELERAAAIAAKHERGDGALVLMGDKSVLFSASGQAFLMFAKRGRSWIALLDPIGPRAEWPELIWRFVELAAAHAGRAAFYQIRPDSLPFYIETGLRIIKIGEEARIPLPGFSLEGPRRTHLRYALKRGARDGLTFELAAPSGLPAMTPDLEAISNEWLSARGRREKGFSVAAYDPAYVAAQTIAVVRHHGRPIAFATVMTTATKQEAVLGLMRHVNHVSPYAMEFLFANLILALKDEGYESFSLGVAPLSGLSDLPFAARWCRLGNLIWKHGSVVYNFQGLRLFKNKFDPVWEPRYLAVSGALGPLFALTDVAALTNVPVPE